MINRRSMIQNASYATVIGAMSAEAFSRNSQAEEQATRSTKANELQSAKQVVLSHYKALATATLDNVAATLAERTSDNWLWRGMHPFHEKRGARDVAESFWKPFMAAMTPVQRRMDLFLAGRNEMDGYKSNWVVSMGHLMGMFSQPWLNIRPSGRIAMLRYAEFNRVEANKIVETAFFFDIPHLMIQADQNPFPPQTAAHLVQPGPATHDGLMVEPQDPKAGERTLALINSMISDFGDDQTTPHARLARSWNEDMIWWGPAGIGAAYTIDGYIKQHAGPFNDALTDGYKFNGHICRLAEGKFGGFFGWANLTVKNSGGYLGMTASPHPADLRVVDLYREENGKLAENWVFIDILHYLNMQGLDVLARMASLQP